MTRAQEKAGRTAIPESVRTQVADAVQRFNREELEATQCYYEARFRGNY